jgi:hypothetical protein
MALEEGQTLYEMLTRWYPTTIEDEIANLKFESSVREGLSSGATYVAAIVAFELLVLTIKDVYEKVRDNLKNDNFASGFSQGLIMGLLGWKWRQVVDLFSRRYVLHMYREQDLNEMRVAYYNLGLRLGYHHAATLTPEARAAYLKAARKDSGATAGDWDRNDQISYVIALAAAFRKRFMNF